MSEVWGKAVRLSPVAVVGVPEVVGDLATDVAAEIAARYGAVLSADVRAVRVSAGFTPPDRIQALPFKFWGKAGAAMAASRRREEAAQGVVVQGGPAAEAAPRARKLTPRRAPDESVIARRAPAVAACLARGLSYTEAAAELGLSRHQLEDTRKYLGRHPEMMPPNPRAIRGARLRAEALAMLHKGLRPSQIAAALGMAKTHSVYAYLPDNWPEIREGAACAPS